MSMNEQPGAKRPNRNMMWLIGLAIAALVVGALALNSRSSVTSPGSGLSASAQNTGGTPPVGQAVPGGG